MSWLPKRDKLDPVQASAVDFAVAFGLGLLVAVQAAAWISLTLARAEKGVVLEVADSGCGIPRCEQAVMYERFYRGAAANRCPGIGLGLSMVHSIVMFYHGDIICVSDVGKGTSFRVFLPC